MTAQVVNSDPQASAAPAPLVRLTIASVIGAALALIYLMVFVSGRLHPPLAAFVVLGLVSAGLAATRIRWAPLFCALFLIAILGMNLMRILAALGNPQEPSFAPVVAIVASVLAGVPAGIATGIQRLRGTAPAAPRWLGTALVGLAGLVVGAVAVAAIPVSGGLSAGVGPEALAALPAVEARDYKFTQDVYRVKVGQTAVLRLENRDNDTHTFTVDDLNLDVKMPARATSLAVFTPTRPGTYTIYCVPHYNKASGQGMKATLVVER